MGAEGWQRASFAFYRREHFGFITLITAAGTVKSVNHHALEHFCATLASARLGLIAGKPIPTYNRRALIESCILMLWAAKKERGE